MKKFDRLINLLEDKNDVHTANIRFYFQKNEEGGFDLRVKGYSVVFGKGETEYDAILDAKKKIEETPEQGSSIILGLLDGLGQEI